MPDTTELRIRFVFGAVFGAAVGFFGWGNWGGDSSLGMAVATIGSGLLCGLLARHFGDRFWQ